MKPRPSTRASAELLSSWKRRHDDLRTRLHESPGSEHAWLWRIRCDILAFLLSRYSNAPASRTPTANRRTRIQPATYPIHTNSSVTPTHAGRAPRQRGEFRERLQRLHETVGPLQEARWRADNAERLAAESRRWHDLRRELARAKIKISRPIRHYGDVNGFVAEERMILQQHRTEIQQLVADHTMGTEGLNDDEILAILNDD